MAEPDFIQTQREFAAHIRDPQGQARPADVEDRRMKIYRDLFYNNVEGFLSNAFPVLRCITDDTTWHALVRDFFHHHESHTPLFMEIPREFLMYLEQERGKRPEDPAFLWELCHYEWVELALAVAEENPPAADLDSDGHLLDNCPVFSALAWPLSYQFAVHKIGPDLQPTSPDETATHLLVYRDRQDEVGFLELNPVSARLAGLLVDSNGRTGRQLLEQISTELQHPNPETVINGGLEILQAWRQRDIILGTVAP